MTKHQKDLYESLLSGGSYLLKQEGYESYAALMLNAVAHYNSTKHKPCPTCGDSDCIGGLPCETGDGV